MICALVDNLFDLYLDGRLVESQARWIKSHLASCPTCAAKLAAWQKILRQLRTFPAQPAPPSFKADLKAALLNDKNAESTTDISVNLDLTPVRVPSFSLALGFLAFMLFVSGSVFGPGIPSQSSSGNATSVCVADPIPTGRPK